MNIMIFLANIMLFVDFYISVLKRKYFLHVSLSCLVRIQLKFDGNTTL